jgi:hypothetical protein
MSLTETLKGVSQKTINTILSVGPLLISQSDKASEAFQRHLGRIAEAEALKDLLKGEVETRNAIRRSLLERFVEAQPEERVRIEQDIEYIDSVTRQLRITVKSLDYKNSDSPSPQPTENQTRPIQDHWIDRFNELARKHNEEWRNELLARALAAETLSPGTVSPRVLWLIGNLEETVFKALSDLLDLCIYFWPEMTPFLPHSAVQAFDRKIARTDTDITIGHLVFQLADVGVLADHLTSQKQIPEGSGFIVRYDENAYFIHLKKLLPIRGILFTPLGESIARFYEPQWNPSGASVLSDWIDSLTPDGADVQRISLQNGNS